MSLLAISLLDLGPEGIIFYFRAHRLLARGCTCTRLSQLY